MNIWEWIGHLTWGWSQAQLLKIKGKTPFTFCPWYLLLCYEPNSVLRSQLSSVASQFFFRHVIMVLVEGLLLRESIGDGSEVHGYDNKVFEVSSDSYFSVSDFSSSINLSTIEGSSDLSTFFSQLPTNMGEKVGENVVASVVDPIGETGTS